ncbi:MAG: membrane protein insertase YidC [Phycisphaerales bacterium]|nr:MAG: membrane protein insertase YidC [Phycisphaerales bacterium]
MKAISTLIVFCFVVLCGWLVIESGLFEGSSRAAKPCILLQKTTVTAETGGVAETPAAEQERLEPASSNRFDAVGGFEKRVTLGSVDPESDFKFQVELDSKGAAIRRATFSEFDDRDPDNPQPLVFLSPVRFNDGREILSMANGGLQTDELVDRREALPLDKIHWKSFDVETESDGTEIVRFEALVVHAADEPLLKLTKTYRVLPDSYLLDCSVTVENLSETEQGVRFRLAGPIGLGREALRTDARKIVGGFMASDGKVISTRKVVATSFFGKFKNRLGLKDAELEYLRALQEIKEARTEEDKEEARQRKEMAENNLRIGAYLPDEEKIAPFLWAAVTNKYFAAILVPIDDEGKDYCDWVKDKRGSFHNPDQDSKGQSGDEAIGFDLGIAPVLLRPASESGSSRTYDFRLYLGPKDKSLFDKNQYYRERGFVETIDFMPCLCCPTCIIHPLAFGILALMKWMYAFIPNYGVVIIILVFLMRLVMHPVTKKSQVSMSKMTKLAPKAEALKKKYANNKAELNKQLMQLYREQGASPIMGMLPMMVQMPIWIALWSAVYASIDLRGAAFLPVWITDLSMPDALVRFATVTVPLLGWKIESLNLLPLMMGLAFYLQQKLMPTQAAASANPQAAQQQKMMMVMMPLLFPLMLYKAPSGVNLYIMASTFAGVVEQHVIRKHIREKEEAESKGLVAVTSKTGGKVKKKKPKPFFKNM